jgi:uncharacterized protein YndB with AHSA1/START domain
MPQAASQTTIARPREEVFAYLANAENDRAWRPGVLEIARVSGEGAGARYRQVVAGPGGRRIDADIEVTHYEPPARLAFRTLAGPVRPVGSYELEEVACGTRVRFTLTAELGGLKRAMAPMVRRTMAAEVGSIDTLRQVLER